MQLRVGHPPTVVASSAARVQTQNHQGQEGGGRVVPLGLQPSGALPSSGWGPSPSFYLLRTAQRGEGGHRAPWLGEREQAQTPGGSGSSLSPATEHHLTLSTTLNFWEPPIPRRGQGECLSSPLLYKLVVRACPGPGKTARSQHLARSLRSLSVALGKACSSLVLLL